MIISASDMENRLVRYRDLVPCKTAFIDSKTPGSDQKENFTIIGPGVSENPGQYVHVKIPHGFNIGGARQPEGCVNSQHSHETAEVFLVHQGAWAFRWGHDGTDGEIVLHPGDVISIPVNVFRGFECVEGDGAFLFAILGGDDPGHVTWAPYVFEQAADYGLVLTKKGLLVDTSIGEQIPEDDAPCAPTTMEDVSRFRRLSHEEMRACVVTTYEGARSPFSDLETNGKGVEEYAILGPCSDAEGLPAGKAPISHGFHFRRINLSANAYIPPHKRMEEEVVFVHRGELSIYWGENFVDLQEGDTITLPIGLARYWRSQSGGVIFVVRGGDKPAAVEWAL